MNLLDLARSAFPTDAPPTVATLRRTATTAEAAELRALIERVLADCPAEIEETVQVALADVDDALVCFRALVADLPTPAGALPVLPTCEQCLNLKRARDASGCRRCTAAGRGELPGVHSRFCPDPSSPRRCLAFVPQPGDPDRRPGAERWPWLDEKRYARARGQCRRGFPADLTGSDAY